MVGESVSVSVTVAPLLINDNVFLVFKSLISLHFFVFNLTVRIYLQNRVYGSLISRDREILWKLIL